ncbi:MAG: hypothetical protein ACRD4B_04810, partial [Acidobacteriota bacterium]
GVLISMAKKDKKSSKAKTEKTEEAPVAKVTETSSKTKSRKKLVLSLVVALVLIGAAVGVGFLYKAYTDQKERADRLTNPTEAAKEETRLLIEKVGSLTELPNDEPTIATVRDVTKLQDQSFFQNAQNGDKVLIFTQAKKAVLYRPSTEKIIEIAPVNLGSGEAQGTETESKPKTETKKPEEHLRVSHLSAEAIFYREAEEAVHGSTVPEHRR